MEKACKFGSFAPDCTVPYVENDTDCSIPFFVSWKVIQNTLWLIWGYWVPCLESLSHLRGFLRAHSVVKMWRDSCTLLLIPMPMEALCRTVYVAGIECGWMSFLGSFEVVLQFLASYHFIIFGYASNITLACICDPAAVLQCVYCLVTTGWLVVIWYLQKYWIFFND